MPVLDLVDDVTGERDTYRGKFGLSIIGAGPTLEELVMFTPEEILRFNMGSDPIWTPVSEVAHGEYFSMEENGLTFVFDHN